jgi:hypothetical protein
MKNNIFLIGAPSASKVIAAFLIIAAMKASAGDFQLKFDTVFSGTAPTGTAPWLQAEFKDVSPNTVSLTISTAGLQGTEFISDFYFNLNPSLDANSLSLSQTSKTGSFANAGIATGNNTLKADGDGYYCVDLSFATANGSTFTVGDSVTYQITGITGLDAADFDFTSTGGGGEGSWIAAAHVQSIGANGSASGWAAPTQFLAVPEPSTVLLSCLAMGLCGGARWVRNRNGRG